MRKINKGFGVPRSFTPKDRSTGSEDVSQLPATDGLVSDPICKLAEMTALTVQSGAEQQRAHCLLHTILTK